MHRTVLAWSSIVTLVVGLLACCALWAEDASVAFWYQTLPTAPFPKLPDKDALEVN